MQHTPSGKTRVHAGPNLQVSTVMMSSSDRMPAKVATVHSHRESEASASASATAVRCTRALSMWNTRLPPCWLSVPIGCEAPFKLPISLYNEPAQLAPDLQAHTCTKLCYGKVQQLLMLSMLRCSSTQQLDSGHALAGHMSGL